MSARPRESILGEDRYASVRLSVAAILTALAGVMLGPYVVLFTGFPAGAIGMALAALAIKRSTTRWRDRALAFLGVAVNASLVGYTAYLWLGAL